MKAAPPTDRFYLKVEQPGRPPLWFPLDRPPVVIGKGAGCDLVLQENTVSRRHARLSAQDDGWLLEDLGSKNGLFSASGKEARFTLRPEIPVWLGQAVLTLIAPAAAVPEPAAAVESGGEEAHLLAASRAEFLARCESGGPRQLLEAEARALLREILRGQCQGPRETFLHPQRFAALEKKLFQETLGLGPLQPFLADPEINEIMVLGCRAIYLERHGHLEKAAACFADEAGLRRVMERIVAPLGRRLDEGSPAVDARLPDGSRVHAILPPLSLAGPCLTIRKFRPIPLALSALVENGTLDQAAADFLRQAVLARRNLLISGGTASGKTTLLNILAACADPQERILTIEDAAELRLPQEHVVALEARPANIEGAGAVTIRELLRHALRMRPDRLVVGECRGGEAFDMLQAMNTGHDGSLATLHANSPRDALARLETMVLLAGVSLPLPAVREQIARGIQLIVHMERRPGGRRVVAAISELAGLEEGTLLLQEIFGRGAGEELRPSGLIPNFLQGEKRAAFARSLP